MKAMILLDVPDFQIGQEVMVYFPDTMKKHGKCEPLKEQPEAVKPISAEAEDMPGYTWYVCPDCKISVERGFSYCPRCGRRFVWK